jgi:hypothetical protein
VFLKCLAETLCNVLQGGIVKVAAAARLLDMCEFYAAWAPEQKTYY